MMHIMQQTREKGGQNLLTENGVPKDPNRYYHAQEECYILTFDPAKNAFQGDAPEEVTHSNGSYERKSRRWKLADEMGRGKKFHGTLID